MQEVVREPTEQQQSLELHHCTFLLEAISGAPALKTAFPIAHLEGPPFLPKVRTKPTVGRQFPAGLSEPGLDPGRLIYAVSFINDQLMNTAASENRKQWTILFLKPGNGPVISPGEGSFRGSEFYVNFPDWQT
ncbi:hypothetical protein MG293_011726 [Ovis ammon polii]|uniref:Uncharacterized protein n=1 Tax=Ovis ammon polii TaxID=230172 RepID=A0AAD4U0Z5_OVIAM|nr:hypothetical protein MG293_011726 [Ovis ammon polii]